MATPKVYVICDNNCKYEGMTKEAILAAIAQAIETGTVGECDTGFITTIKTINGSPLKFFVGEQSEYEALSEEAKANLFAIITNDTTKDALLAAVDILAKDSEEMAAKLEKVCNGDTVVPNANSAASARSADIATRATSADTAETATEAEMAEVANSVKAQRMTLATPINALTAKDTRVGSQIHLDNGLILFRFYDGHDYYRAIGEISSDTSPRNRLLVKTASQEAWFVYDVTNKFLWLTYLTGGSGTLQLVEVTIIPFSI